MTHIKSKLHGMHGTSRTPYSILGEKSTYIIVVFHIVSICVGGLVETNCSSAVFRADIVLRAHVGNEERGMGWQMRMFIVSICFDK